MDFNTFMASNQRYIVVEIDGSGSSGRGSNLMSRVKRRLGQEEVNDQIEAVKHLLDTYEYIDPKHVAVTGVSYGGYVSGMILADRDSDLFKCGVAVSPVVDWRFYGN